MPDTCVDASLLCDDKSGGVERAGGRRPGIGAACGAQAGRSGLHGSCAQAMRAVSGHCATGAKGVSQPKTRPYNRHSADKPDIKGFEVRRGSRVYVKKRCASMQGL